MIVLNSEPQTLASMLGSILNALIDSQAESARTTVDFITAVGFVEQPQGSQPPELNSVQFKYFKKNEKDEETSFTLAVPLLSIVHIPTILIKTATIAFDYEMLTINQQPPTSNGKKSTLIGVFPRRLFIPSTQSTQHQTANLAVKIEVEQAPVSVGLSRVFEALELATKEKTSP